MFRARAAIVIIGILLPYLARIPGAFLHGPQWLTSFFGNGLPALLFLGLFNAFNWGSILLATAPYRHPVSTLFPAIIGFALPAAAHGALDLQASSTAAVGLVFIPLFSLPLVLAGWLAGLVFDRKLSARKLP